MEKDRIAEADRYVVPNEFGEIVDREGGVGLNAFTNSDETGYFFSFPANRLELWAYLESERYLKPLMREFYKERDVVHEERRMFWHYRADFPKKDDENWRKHNMLQKGTDPEEVRVFHRPIVRMQ